MPFFLPRLLSYGAEPLPLPAEADATAGEAKGKEGSVVVELTGLRRRGNVGVRWLQRRGNVGARWLQTKWGTDVVAMCIRWTGAKLTLHYTHGNTADLASPPDVRALRRAQR